MASSFETTLFPIVQTINEYLSNYVLVIHDQNALRAGPLL